MANQQPQTRDQHRAQHAYACIEAVPAAQRPDYKILVYTLGTNILRSGLAVAVSILERECEKRPEAAQRLRKDLAGAGLPGLAGIADAALGDRIRGLSLQEYLLVSREMLKVVTWFKRAVQAKFGGD